MSRPRHLPLRAVTLAAAIAAAGAAVAVPGGVAHAAPPAGRAADFNGDGHADLAVGAPGGTVGGHAAAGYVAVVYGAAGGVSAAKHAVVSLNTSGVPGAAEPGDRFGAKVVPADLNGDGFTDLLVGAPGEDVGSAADAGMITVLWGGPKGLASATAIDTGATPGWAVGRAFAAGDFDGDGRPDVAYPANAYLDVLSAVGADGRPAAHGRIVTWEATEADPLIGDDVAAGDVNGDGISDLAMTASGVDEADSRTTSLFLGGSHGDLTAGGLGYRGLLLDPKGYWLDGESVAIGDVNKDGFGDVVVGHTHEGFPSDALLPVKGGAIGISYGGPDGRSGTLEPTWINQDSRGVPGVSEPGDRMGADVAVGDVDGDGYADVLAGVPGEDFDGLTDPGSFLLLKGGAQGLTGAGAQVFSQNSAGLPGVAEAHDRFGAAVDVLPAAGADHAQAAVGDPAENAGNGAVWVLHGTPAGLTGTATANFGSATMGASATAAEFGAALDQR